MKAMPDHAEPGATDHFQVGDVVEFHSDSRRTFTGIDILRQRDTGVVIHINRTNKLFVAFHTDKWLYLWIYPHEVTLKHRPLFPIAAMQKDEHL